MSKPDFVDPLAATVTSSEPTGNEHAEPIHRTERYTSEDEQPVGVGGGGTVIATRDVVLRRRVAVKRLRSAAEAAFINEARIAAQLDHPAIVPTFDLFRDATGTLCVAMRLVEGESLSVRLRRARSLDQRLKVLPAMLQVAQALAYAHRRGVVHLDLKPHNVMLGGDGQTYVIDWGLARAVERSDQGVDVSGGLEVSSAGTPAYWSPEQARGGRPDKRADVWGLGAVLFEVLTGRAPWDGPTAAEAIAQARTGEPPRVEAFAPDAPRELVAICHKALQREPAARYPSAIEFSADLEAWFDGRAVSARRRTWREALVALVRRNPWPVAAVVFAFACVVVSAVVVTARVREERDEARKLSRVFGQAASRGIEPRPDNERLLKEYTQATERYFERLGNDVTDVDRINLALAWDRLSRIHMRLGQYDLSRTEAERALALSKPVATGHPEDGAAQEALVGALISLGSLAQIQGEQDEMVALRTQALVAADAAALRDATNPIWVELRAIALTRWLYDVSESTTVPPERVAQAAELSDLATRDAIVKPRTAMLLDTWLMEERWRRGELSQARQLVARVDAWATKVLGDDPIAESRGLAMYSLLMAGMVCAWSNEPERAAAFWGRVEQTAAQVDVSRPGNRPMAFERARAWIAMGRVAEAREGLRQLVKEGFPVVGTERLAALLLEEPLTERPSAAEDALDALVLALYAARGGYLHDAATLLLDARAKGVSRQLFSTPGMMERAVAGMPTPLAAAADAFAKRWDDAVARGDVAATDQALEAFAAALETARAH